MEIVWTEFAKITYFEVLENLKERWTINEVQEFHGLTNAILNNIKRNQIEFPTVNTEFGIKKSRHSQERIIIF